MVLPRGTYYNPKVLWSSRARNRRLEESVECLGGNEKARPRQGLKGLSPFLQNCRDVFFGALGYLGPLVPCGFLFGGLVGRVGLTWGCHDMGIGTGPKHKSLQAWESGPPPPQRPGNSRGNSRPTIASLKGQSIGAAPFQSSTSTRASALIIAERQHVSTKAHRGAIQRHLRCYDVMKRPNELYSCLAMHSQNRRAGLYTTLGGGG